MIAQYDERRYKFVNLDYSETSSNISTSKISNLSSISSTPVSVSKWISPRNQSDNDKIENASKYDQNCYCQN